MKNTYEFEFNNNNLYDILEDIIFEHIKESVSIGQL